MLGMDGVAQGLQNAGRSCNLGLFKAYIYLFFSRLFRGCCAQPCT